MMNPSIQLNQHHKTDKPFYYDYTENQNKKRYTHKTQDFNYIYKATAPDTPITRKEQDVLANISNMIRRSPNKVITISSEEFSNLTENKKWQNNVIRKHLSHILHSQYKKAVLIGGVIKQKVIVFKFTQEGEKILANPLKYYKGNKSSKPPTLKKLENGRPPAPIYKDENNIKKNRSMKSNLISSYSRKKEGGLKPQASNPFSLKPKTLNDFYPLKESDCKKLQSLSGRSFSLNAMNEIIKDMAKRLKDKIFYSSKGFFAYMAKAFSYELRNENQINNETFRIKANYSNEENKTILVEKFLTKIEESSQTSLESQFKKHIAYNLKPDTAYDILSNYKKLNRVGDKLKIHLRKKIEIQESVKETILNKATVIFNTINPNGGFNFVKEIEFVFENNKTIKENLSEKLANITDIRDIDQLSLLQKIRKYLMNYEISKEQAIAIDKAWFSRVEIFENNDKKIKLKAPSPFYRDYIISNYMHKIEKIIKTLGYNYIEMCNE